MARIAKLKISNTRSFLLVAIFTVASGCTPLISKYDQYSYTQTTSLKVDALNLMGEATEDYKQHEGAAKALTTNIQKLIEYEKHLPKNALTIDQWNVLTDTSGNLLGGFLKEWKIRRVLKPGYIPLKQDQVSRGFDEIIKLETSKIHH